MRVFFDTEFIERPCTIELISIGLVTDTGREYYAVSSDFDPKQASPWVKANVIAKLGREKRIPKRQIARDIRAFLRGTKPEFWAYYADYDWVVFCWLFGTMMQLPDDFPKYCRDLKQRMDDLGLDKDDLPAQPKNAHHALADARWCRDACHYVDRVMLGVV